MKLLSLKLRNFLSYASQDIDFSKLNGVVFLIGKVNDDTSKSNGSGKSAVFDAIGWSLFGSSRTTNDDELIRVGEKEVIVDLKFELDGKAYNINRSRKKNKSQVLSFNNDTDGIHLTGNSVKETQQAITKVLGLDEELYENTVFARQGCIDLFPRQTPAHRKVMLCDILKISEYEKFEIDAKEFAKTYETQYESMKMLVEQLQNEISGIATTDADVDTKRVLVEQVQQKIKRIELDIEEKNKEYNQLKANKQLLDKEYDSNIQIKDDINRVEKQLAYIDTNAKKELDKILLDKNNDLLLIKDEDRINRVLAEVNTKLEVDDSARQKYEMLVQQQEMLENEMRRLLNVIKDYETEVNKMRNKLTSFRELKDKCPLCQSVLDEAQKQKVENEIIGEGKGKKEYKDKLQEEYDKARVTYDSLKTEIKSINLGVGKNKELENDKAKYESELLSIQIAKNRVEYAGTRAEETKTMFMRQKVELSFELERKKGDLVKSDKMIEGYKAQLGDVEKIETEISGMNDIRNTYITEEKKLAEEIHKLQYELETKKKKQQELSMNTTKIDKTKMDFFIYSELAKAFGKNGIPLLVIENALAELQSEVMNQLNILTDGAISIEFRTQKELKSGKTADALDILVSDRSGTKDFNLYSGGEKMRIALAIRLGLSRLLSRRAGRRFETLIIDEISDLDVHGMRKFVDLINIVSKDYKQVFVVSHISELKDSFNQVIEVVKTKEGSKIYGI